MNPTDMSRYYFPITTVWDRGHTSPKPPREADWKILSAKTSAVYAQVLERDSGLTPGEKRLGNEGSTGSGFKNAGRRPASY